MNETFLVLLAGASAGLFAAFIGGILLYRYRSQTHLRVEERLEAERTALQEDVSEIGEEELAETEAGKELLALSQAAIQRFGYARESPATGLKRHNYDLLKQIDEYRKELSQRDERLAGLEAMQQESARVIEELKRQNTDLRFSNSLKSNVVSTNSAKIEQDLRMTLKEVARLQNQLGEANMRFIQAEAEGVTTFTRELRQTLSATLQYVDLLLDESTGNLNAMQRNFLETIKASTVRLHNVIEDVTQLAAFKAHARALAHDLVDVRSMINDATAETSSQFRAKRISLHADVPEDLGPVYADGEALKQVLLRLLVNAEAASPLQGDVNVRVQSQTDAGKEYLLLQVSDHGEGIPPEDLQRVFVPLYRVEDVPARGVGEAGMGLFIAKTLTEAQSGRIWVDTELGAGSTYNVLIPITRKAPVDVSAEE